MKLDFGKTLVTWYLKNKRDLPWRNTTEPYYVWLSEIILQQTRVDQGLAYYHAFVAAFPNVNSLANAKEDKVLKLWQGLGYYSRARNLKKAAQIISRDHKGVFPKTKNELLKLPGVGPYTASAISSFCYREVTPVLDGNVYRFISRFFGILTPIDSTKARPVFEELLTELIDNKRPDLFNQAIMEFGALQCTPKSPDCSNCVFGNACYAFSKNQVNDFPLKAKKTKISKVFYEYFMIRNKKDVYINKRTGKGIWENLFQFPLLEFDSQKTIEEVMKDKQFISLFKNTNFRIENVSSEMIHLLSHRKIYYRFWEIKVEKESAILKSQIKIKESMLHKYAVPRLIERFLANK